MVLVVFIKHRTEASTLSVVSQFIKATYLQL